MKRVMKIVCAVAIVLALICSTFAEPVLDDDLIAHINSKNVGWKAGRNPRFENVDMKEVRNLLGVKPSWDGKRRIDVGMPEAVPTSFDARTQWPSCIGAIRNQEQCGSCWAFSATEVLADRYCIATGNKVVLSPEYVLECDTVDQGCNGGNLNYVWNFLEQQGTVTDSCDPYTSGSGNVNNACPTTCQDGSKLTTYTAKHAKQINGVSAIQTEIMTNGPVQAAFSVYQDFFSYTSGVYKHVSGGLAGGHAIKVVGWGVSGSEPYWIVANSWGADWGIDGFFWILKGHDECGIEDDVWAGLSA